MLPEENRELYNKIRRRALVGVNLIMLSTVLLCVALTIGEQYRIIYWSLITAWVILKAIGFVCIISALIEKKRKFN